ncbi:hypothetical protein [Agathobaculum sp.]|uniref:hypothetical protein n=1 Tax=Agathobaculum sp. TaxID=2048138 RepID=UPI003A91CADC
MLGVNQSDFMSYMSALKSNYRKGVHRMEAILSNPTHAKEFATNLGGVSVVLGVPVNLPDRNSDKLLELLLGSDVADDAVETWLHQFYEFTGWDDLLSDSARCKEMANNPLIWRAAGGSKLAVGKSIATLAGLSCSAYKDIDAVAASSVAMAAVIGNATALNAVVTSSVAMAAVAASQVAMAAVASSQVAMAAVAASATARAAVCASDVAYNYLLSKATFDTISGQYTRSGWSTRYAKPCIVLKWCYSYNSGTSGIRTCLDGTASRQYTGTQRYNSSMGSNTYNDHAEKNGTYYKEFVFCSKLETYNSQSDWPAISIAYFPLP